MRIGLLGVLLTLFCACCYGYNYQVFDENNVTITTIRNKDVLNYEKLKPLTVSNSGNIILKVMDPLENSFTFSNYQIKKTVTDTWDSTSFQYFYNDPYSISITTKGTYLPTFSLKSGGPILGTATVLQYQYHCLQFNAKAQTLNTNEVFEFYVQDTSQTTCTQTQAGTANGIICTNGGTCVAQLIGNSCTCPSNRGGDDCSGCASGYYGPNCIACSCPTNSHCNDGSSIIFKYSFFNFFSFFSKNQYCNRW